jgi:hypothetical protein
MTTAIRARLRGAVLTVLLLSCGAPAAGQPTDTQRIDEAIKKRWAEVLKEVAARHGLPVENNHLGGSKEKKPAAYKEIVDTLQADPALLALIYPDPKNPEYQRLVGEKVRDEDRNFIEQLKKTGASGSTAKSVNSRSTNPAAGQLTERSGFAELIALALDGSNVVSANDSAISLNLSALALFSLADPEVYSELYRYQQHSLMRRIGGTFVFGAKIPEKDITGLSNLPDFDKLLDVFVWDVKVRVWGNRDLRDERWYPLTLGRGGFNSQFATTISSSLPVEDFMILQPILLQVIDPAQIKRQAARSPQLSVKATGTHLTEETGKNKYGGAVLFDTGLGNADLTANVLYSVADDLRLGASNPFQVKQWSFNGAVTGKLAADALVSGSAIEWSSGVVANVFANKSSLPVPAKNTWKIFTTFDIPLSAAARIPFSVVYTNDANALTKTKHVSGQLGISYDFSALSKLFGGGK